MSIAVRWMKLLESSREGLGKPAAYGVYRYFADKAKSSTTSKQAIQGNSNEEKIRVRRARPSDLARIIRFVKEHARVAWPGITPPLPSQNILFEDYVARSLAQAEQQEAKRWGKVRGLALNTAVCPWDAFLLEKWAQCIKCARTKKLMLLTAHCLRAPGIHDKYKVHTVLQVILMIAPNSTKPDEIAQMLAKHSLQRGADVGIPVLRFDVTSDTL
ncbi:unnamed protein product [Leptidea sinapis]|uniref:Uncharacterized protein n=1 Tax=Leptidea sinapis TaxID=189913 RepID=A0A5E4PYK8_9NEOP|nr:unnamed protein product [Leptidea sinapis]